MLFIDEFFKILKDWEIQRAIDDANQSVLAGEKTLAEISSFSAVLKPKAVSKLSLTSH